MIKEALEYVANLSPISLKTLDGRQYADRPLTLVAPPVPPTVHVETLKAFVTLAAMKIDDLKHEDSFVHIDSHTCVSLRSSTSDAYGRRQQYVLAKMSALSKFAFDQFMDAENFVIGLQTQFVGSAEVTRLIALASSLTVSNVSLSEDDGVTQMTTVKKGVSLKETTAINPRAIVAPYRTFREVEQPASDFLFRLKSREGMLPVCALFEADGGAWKIEAVKNIQEWLKTNLPAELQEKIVF